MALHDLTVDVLNGQCIGLEHGKGGEVALQTEIHEEGTGLLVHGTQEQQVLDKLTFFQLFTVEDGAVISDVE